MLENKYNKIIIEINEIKTIIENKLKDKKDELIEILKGLINLYYEDKMGGPIVKINKNYEKIIIEKDGKYYENNLDYSKQLYIKKEEINERKYILDNLDKKLIDNIKDIKIVKNKLVKIKEIEKLENNYLNIKIEKEDNLYLKKIDKNNKKIDKLLKIYSLLLYYKENLEFNTDIFNYYTNLE